MFHRHPPLLCRSTEALPLTRLATGSIVTELPPAAPEALAAP
ncbi:MULTISPECIES: hypothetical protein [Nocardia]|nr:MULTISPECIES: hypothetical protein [Nocardia]